MLTSKTIKRIGGVVTGVVLSGSTLFAVGGGCAADASPFGDVSGLINPANDAIRQFGASDDTAVAGGGKSVNVMRYFIKWG